MDSASKSKRSNNMNEMYGEVEVCMFVLCALFVCLCVYLPVCFVFVCLYIICVSFCLFVCLFVCLFCSLARSFRSFVRLSICFSVCFPVFLCLHGRLSCFTRLFKNPLRLQYGLIHRYFILSSLVK